MEVHVLHRVRDLEDDVQEVKLIGIYSSEAKGRDAMARVSVQPGFRDFPDGLQLEPHELDRDGWVEGFVID